MAKLEQPPRTKSQQRDLSQKKKARGKSFAKGVSGNPAGRPPGSRNKATEVALQLLEGEAEGLARKAIEKALDGDAAALRLCLERLIPVRKDRVIKLTLPPITSIEDVAGGFAALAAAVGKGDITPDEAQRITTLLEQYSKVLEAAELEQRVKQLEERCAREFED